MKLNWTRFEIYRCPNSQAIKGIDDLKGVRGPYVYIIETPKTHAIKYPAGVSSVCYIGRQGERKTGSRGTAHARGWITRHLILSQSYERFRISISPARQRGVENAYKEIESYLIRSFSDKFGIPPIFNHNVGLIKYSFPIEDSSNLFDNRTSEYLINAVEDVDEEAKIDRS